MTDISALEAYAGQLSGAAAQATAASEKQHQYIHGDAQSDVQTETGFVPTVAKQARLYMESIPDAVAELSMQMTDGRIHGSEAEGRALVQNGQYFYARSVDPKVSRTLWQRLDANTSAFIVNDPSSTYVAEVADNLNSKMDSIPIELSDEVVLPLPTAACFAAGSRLTSTAGRPFTQSRCWIRRLVLRFREPSTRPWTSGSSRCPPSMITPWLWGLGIFTRP